MHTRRGSPLPPRARWGCWLRVSVAAVVMAAVPNASLVAAQTETQKFGTKTVSFRADVLNLFDEPVFFGP